MKLAIVQDGPIYNNLSFTVEKTCDLINEASQQNIDLIVFGECWLSGYPIWLDICKDVNLWDHPPIKEVWSNTFENSVDLRTDILDPIKKILKEKKIYAVVGANEKITKGKGNNTIYNTIFTFNQNGDIINHHRKLMPTFTEKLVHGLGDGHGLNSVDTAFGRLGSLICWEHWMPLTRQSMHDCGEDLHIALWPYAKEMHHLASRHYAIEGRCHVVAVGQIMDRQELPDSLEISDAIDLDSSMILKGGSAIYGPDGSTIVAPLYEERTIIYQDVDLKSNRKEHMNLATSGHYQRPDVFDFNVDKARR